MKRIIVLGLMTLAVSNAAAQKKDNSLKKAFKDKFYIGTAMSLPQINGTDVKSDQIITSQYSSIVAENCMKSMFLQPQEGKFFFDDADRFVAFGEKNNMFIIGHTLIWHSQLPKWFFVDKNGKDVSPEVLKQRMKNHITTVVSRYKGRVKGWDVVNEAIMEDGTYRKSKFYEILGEEFIPLAFQYAQEADPNAELYYNDYNEWFPEKVKTVINIVKNMKSRGIKVDGVGMQTHVGLDTPKLAEYEKAIIDYASAGVKVNITEMEISTLPSPWGTSANVSDTVEYQAKMNPYTKGLPQNVQKEWESRYLNFFRLFIKHEDKIRRVTMWGVTDNQSWKNDFPVKGRTDYPLLFDRNFKAKPVVEKIIQLTKEKK
ncbi:endo-1,4-beta-xylanase [Chryseobacterium shandongense]|uniref:Beta-xylanase n=1 Tax=Chryseobacterium shandongense TaxID=1493872 RepID=A0AAD0YI87_9FLAO|nr:endo-1,4-beta-xylanase [Chryseobacterium shandongense]AZA88899.1 endo-1,4-beta-xylanase [Chryseobacterium shandongense]AZA97841.1 endo-1,4-beta-xylanase [Chryseobacterium shandongense]